MKHAALVACGFALSAAGCSNKPSRLEPPSVDASAAGTAAIAEFDANADDAIAGPELDKVPSLKKALKQVDKNGDGRITADEIAARINQWRETKIAIMSMTPSFKLDGRPLADATITFVPEKFLGPAVKAATGTTGPGGQATMMINKANPDEAGMHLGFYRVQVSKQVNGKETIPAKYNAETILGQEVANDAEGVYTGIVFDLKSK
jgi:hypothetical protein